MKINSTLSIYVLVCVYYICRFKKNYQILIEIKKNDYLLNYQIYNCLSHQITQIEIDYKLDLIIEIKYKLERMIQKYLISIMFILPYKDRNLN